MNFGDCKHNSNLANLNASDKGIKIYLVHCSVVDIGSKTIPPMLLIIANEMLGTRLDASTLDADNRLKSTFTIQIWIRPKAAPHRKVIEGISEL